MEGITREDKIKILTQTPFLMLVLGRVMLDSFGKNLKKTIGALGDTITLFL